MESKTFDTESPPSKITEELESVMSIWYFISECSSKERGCSN